MISIMKSIGTLCLFVVVSFALSNLAPKVKPVIQQVAEVIL